MADKKMYKVGITVKEPWSADISYEVLDITLYAVENGGDGCSYIAIRANQGVTPGTDDTVWVKATQRGQSIYDLAVKYGDFEGTEAEFEAEYEAAVHAAQSAAQSASDIEAQVETNEAARAAAERARSDAETARSSAETARINAENARNDAESLRDTAESDRVRAESGRVTAEASRVEAETFRQGAEQSRRQQFEGLKTDMETAIDNVDAKSAEIAEDIEGYEANEAGRVSAENARAAAESARVSAEQGRATAETARQTAEGNRTTAETERVSAEVARATAEQGRVSAEQGRVSAESGRVSAESERVAAETARESASATAVSNAETATQAANTAAEHAEEAATTIDEKIAGKANTDGYYGGMTVGSAENLVGRGSVEADYAGIRTSAGSADIGSGSASVARMKGNSFKWNQLIHNGNFAAGTNWWSTYGSATFSVQDAVLSVTANAANAGALTTISIPKGHKAYFTFDIKGDSAANFLLYTGDLSILYGVPITTTWNRVSRIFSLAWRSSLIWRFANGYTAQLKNVVLIDLTAIFGSGNEPETVEEFDAWRKEMGLTLDYYDYNEGEVINNRASAIETVGFNLYDASTGKAFLPGPYSDYPQEYEICGTFTSISFRDVNGNESVPELTDGRFFNVSAPGELTVVGGNNTDTLVHMVWSGWRNEGEPDYTYEPYWKNTLNLGLTTLKGKLNGTGDSVVIFPNGLAKLGDVRDEIVGNKAIKRIGVVDMGTLTWSRGNRNNTDTGYNYSHSVSGSMNKKNPTSNVLCSKFIPVNPGSAWEDLKNGEMRIPTTNYIVVSDASATAADFKTAMSGVLLYYELETPEEYTLDEPMPSQYRVDDFGTERVIPSYSPSELTAPIAYDVQYAMNAVDAIRRLDDNYVNESQVKQTAGRSETDVYSQKGVDDNYAKKVGLEENLVSGLSRNLAGKDVQTGEFSTAVISGADGLAKINEVMGKSLVWNQLGSTQSESTSTQPTIVIMSPTLTYRAGHKYYIAATVTTPDENAGMLLWGGTSATIHSSRNFSYNLGLVSSLRISVIASRASDVTRSSYASLRAGTTVPAAEYGYNDAVCIDLTQMFGAGNEPTTVEEFEALFPLPYYAHNPGEIISNNTEALEVTGLNQWDEEWENGGYNTTTGNKNDSERNKTRSKNHIPVLNGQTYYIKSPVGLNIFKYDVNGNYLGLLEKAAGSTFVADCASITFSTFGSSYTTYNHDICINVSGSRNGEYEPYQKSELELNLATITGKLNGEGESVTIFPDGMRSAGTVFDSLIVDEDGWCRKAVVRFKKYTFDGTDYIAVNNWRPADGYFAAGFSNRMLPGAIQWSAQTSGPILMADLLTKRYDDLYFIDNPVEGVALYRGDYSVFIRVKSEKATNRTELIQWLNGKSLIYELETPQEYVLDTPIQMTFQAKHGGVIRQLPENGSEPTTAPMRMSVTYALDAVSILTDLPENYVSKESLQAMLSAMQSAGLFSAYTMTFNESTGKYEFTFTANA